MSYINEWSDALLIVLRDSILPSRLAGNSENQVEQKELERVKEEIELRRKKLREGTHKPADEAVVTQR